MNFDLEKHVPELVISYRQSNRLTRKPLTDIGDRVKFLRKLFDKDTFELQEELILVVLDNEYFPRFWRRLTTGTVDECFFPEKLIMQILVASQAPAFILSHNHPNDVAKPSDADIKATYALQHKTRYFGIEYADDVILTKRGYFSYAEQNLYWEHFWFST